MYVANISVSMSRMIEFDESVAVAVSSECRFWSKSLACSLRSFIIGGSASADVCLLDRCWLDCLDDHNIELVCLIEDADFILLVG